MYADNMIWYVKNGRKHVLCHCIRAKEIKWYCANDSDKYTWHTAKTFWKSINLKLFRRLDTKMRMNRVALVRAEVVLIKCMGLRCVKNI